MVEFHIARQESIKDIEGEKDSQEKTFDGIAFVLVDMVRSAFAPGMYQPFRRRYVPLVFQNKMDSSKGDTRTFLIY